MHWTQRRKSFAEQRLVIKYFYEMWESPPEEDWDGPGGTVARIRLRLEGMAPDPRTVRRILERLAAGDDDIMTKPHAGGGERMLDDDEDALVWLLACKGFSQTMALKFLNLKRAQKGLDADGKEIAPPVSLRTLRRAEIRVQLLRRKRRSKKAYTCPRAVTTALPNAVRRRATSRSDVSKHACAAIRLACSSRKRAALG